MPSYNYRCKDCKAEVVFNVPKNKTLSARKVYCEGCDSSRMELLEFSEKEDLQAKKIVEEIHVLHERIERLIEHVEEVRKRIEALEEVSPSDFPDFNDSLVN